MTSRPCSSTTAAPWPSTEKNWSPLPQINPYRRVTTRLETLFSPSARNIFLEREDAARFTEELAPLRKSFRQQSRSSDSKNKAKVLYHWCRVNKRLSTIDPSPTASEIGGYREDLQQQNVRSGRTEGVCDRCWAHGRRAQGAKRWIYTRLGYGNAQIVFKVLQLSLQKRTCSSRPKTSEYSGQERENENNWLWLS